MDSPTTDPTAVLRHDALRTRIHILCGWVRADILSVWGDADMGSDLGFVSSVGDERGRTLCWNCKPTRKEGKKREWLDWWKLDLRFNTSNESLLLNLPPPSFRLRSLCTVQEFGISTTISATNTWWDHWLRGRGGTCRSWEGIEYSETKAYNVFDDHECKVRRRE
jgi:hypothetical protein